jgi:hypothetical protein
MPNAVLARSLEDELEGSLLCNALSLTPITVISADALLSPHPKWLLLFNFSTSNSIL